MMERHVDRLQRGECTIQMGFVFSDLLTNFERVSDHCSNIAVDTLQLKSSKLDSHKFLKKCETRKTASLSKNSMPMPRSIPSAADLLR